VGLEASSWLHLIQDGDPMPLLPRCCASLSTAAEARPHAADPTLSALAEADRRGGRLARSRQRLPLVPARQTPQTSLVPYVLEEAHEVGRFAIAMADDGHSARNWDPLLQVVLARPDSPARRSLRSGAIARGISAKLIRRHPHVFAGAVAADTAAVRGQAGGDQGEEASARAASPRQQQRQSPLSDRLAKAKCAANPPWAGAMTISPKKAASAGSSGTTWAGCGRSAGGAGRASGGGRGQRATGPRPEETRRCCCSPW